MNSLVLIVAIISISITIFSNLPMESLAHTDGCHRWQSCPSDYESYVCGDLGHDDECGGSEEEVIKAAVTDDSSNSDF